MDYEKLYKEAIERAKQWEGNQSCVDYIFPELKEREDEKWRKWLIGHLSGYINQTDDKYAEVCKKAIAWLEKQECTSLVEEIKRRKELYSQEKEKAVSSTEKLSLGGRIAMLEELCAFIDVKQGEQKPSDKKELEKIVIDGGKDEMDYCFTKMMNSEKVSPTWSEEDEENLQHCCGAIAAADYYTYDDKQEMEDWLKTLKQRLGG